MAAAATTRYIFKGRNKVIVDVFGIWDTADETDTIVIDKSTLIGPARGAPGATEPGSIVIEEITWTVGAGFDYILLEWDHTTDDRVDYFQGQGYINYAPFGGKFDPVSAGGTGDLILTSAGGAAGDTYSFLISARLKA